MSQVFSNPVALPVLIALVLPQWQLIKLVAGRQTSDFRTPQHLPDNPSPRLAANIQSCGIVEILGRGHEFRCALVYSQRQGSRARYMTWRET